MDKAILMQLAPEFEFVTREQVSSTNDFAAEMAKNGAREGLVVLADSQTNGRGRQGRSFYSPEDTGLYMSLVLRPRELTPASITAAAAVAVAETLEELSGKKALIKWVNDVFMDGRKVCGILAEGAMTPHGVPEYAVLGIGVDLLAPDGGYPPELETVAGAVFSPGQVWSKEAVAAGILNRFWELYRDSTELHQRYKARCFVLGKTVTVLGAVPRLATAVGLDEAFRLMVRLEDGTVKALDSGEISVTLPMVARNT